jgi:hypothetical protein
MANNYILGKHNILLIKYIIIMWILYNSFESKNKQITCTLRRKDEEIRRKSADGTSKSNLSAEQ